MTIFHNNIRILLVSILSIFGFLSYVPYSNSLVGSDLCTVDPNSSFCTITAKDGNGTNNSNDSLSDISFQAKGQQQQNQQLLNQDFTNVQDPNSTLETYLNSTLGFSIQYPAGSKISENGDIIAFTLPSSQSPSSYVIVQTKKLPSANMSLEQYTNVTLDALSQSHTSFSMIDQSTVTTLSNNPAHKIMYTDARGQNETQFKTMQLWTIKGDKVYDILYIANYTNFEKSLPIAEEMISAFKIENEENETQIPSLDLPRIDESTNNMNNQQSLTIPKNEESSTSSTNLEDSFAIDESTEELSPFSESPSDNTITIPSNNSTSQLDETTGGSSSGEGKQQFLTPIPSEQGNSMALGELGEDQMSNSVSNEISCGQVIRESIELTADLNCSSDGLIVSSEGKGITINLNGFSINGPGVEGEEVGIIILDDEEVRVTGPGKIGSFQAGIMITKASNIDVSGVTFENNDIGVFAADSNIIHIQKNNLDNNNIGLAFHSSEEVNIISNEINTNKLDGITFVNTGQSNIENNEITGSTTGVFLDGQSHDNSVTGNNLKDNSVDLNNGDGIDADVTKSIFADNSCTVSVPEGLCDAE